MDLKQAYDGFPTHNELIRGNLELRSLTFRPACPAAPDPPPRAGASHQPSDRALPFFGNVHN